MNNIANEAGKRISWLDDAAFYVILGVMFLLPIFFIPTIVAPFQFTKTLLFLVGILVAFFLYVVSRLEDGKITLSYNPVLLAAWALPLVYFISAFFSGNLKVSLIGQGFNVDTFSFITAAVLLMSIIPLLLRSKEKILRVYVTLLASFGILALFQILRLIFGADFLSFGVFTGPASNLIGKWNDLAIFFGLAVIMSLVTLEGLQLNKQAKGILYGTLVISLFFLTVINFFPVWLIVGLFALGFFVYRISKGTFGNWKKTTSFNEGEENTPTEQSKNKVSFISLATLVVTLAFIVFGSTLGNYTSSLFNITQLEARPSWQSTVDIAKQTYKEDNLLFGSGPNTFSRQWVKFKPEGINNTLFWNIDFTSSIGIIPTAFITAGVLGGIAWIVFLGIFLYRGFRALILRPTEDKYVYYLMLSSFLGSLYLWILSIVYIPSSVMMVFAFFMTGIFLATLRYQKNAAVEKEIIFSANPRLGFVAVLLLTVLLIVDSVALYIVGQQYISSLYFQRSAIALNVDGNLDAAERYLTQAIRLERSDRSLRFASELQLIRLNEVLSSGELSQEEQRNQFQLIFSSSVQNAQAATDIDSNNYQNWMTLGRVYGSVVPLQIEGAYENALRSYNRALELNPHNPLAYLTLAQLEVSRGNNEKAQELVNRAIEEKNNYTAAIFLLAQIQVQEGNLTEAISSVEAAAFLSPTNPVVFFQLGLLKYNVNDNLGAIGALEQAVALNSVYSNARYFLGLSYYRMNRNEDAIVQFENIATLNPNNNDVTQILQNLRSGNNPFFSDTAPNQTNNLESLPIVE